MDGKGQRGGKIGRRGVVHVAFTSVHEGEREKSELEQKHAHK